MTALVPLRARLALASATGMAIVLIGVGVFVYIHLRSDLVASVDMGLSSRAQVMLANASPARAPLTSHRFRLIDADEAFAQVLAPGARIVETTPAVARRPLVSARLLRSITSPRFVDRRPPRLDPARLLVVPARVAGQPRYLVVGATLSDSYEALGTLKLLFEVAIPVGVALCFLIGWLLAGAALNPVERMRAEAEAISAREPKRRLAIPGGDPTLGRLASTLNTTFDRLQAAHERERRFVDDASHELRTPLAILKAEIDTALAGQHEASELAQTLESAAEEVDHLIRIAEGLLVIARANHGQLPIQPTAVSLGSVVDPTVAAFTAPSVERAVRIEAAVPDAIVEVDRTLIRQALDNLLDNALRHTPPWGTVTITATIARADLLAISVQDTGPGFTDDAREGAFQPFHRATGRHPGAGLGLPIVQTIANAHGGSASIRNVPGAGAEVTITIPVRWEPAGARTDARPSAKLSRR